MRHIGLPEEADAASAVGKKKSLKPFSLLKRQNSGGPNLECRSDRENQHIDIPPANQDPDRVRGDMRRHAFPRHDGPACPPQIMRGPVVESGRFAQATAGIFCAF